jgi:hypothetical protein
MDGDRRSTGGERESHSNECLLLGPGKTYTVHKQIPGSEPTAHL